MTDIVSPAGSAGEHEPTARPHAIAPMTASQQTDAVPAPPLVVPQVPVVSEAAWRSALVSRAWLRHLALAPVLVLSAVLNVNHLAQNGYANIFYSAGVKSML